MSYSILFDKDLKAQICNILLSGNTKTANQLFIELKKKNIFYTKRAIFKALSELLHKKIIVKYEDIYEINSEWLNLLSSDANKALMNLLEKNLLGKSVENKKHPCKCSYGNTLGFCNICLETACEHCSVKQMKHSNCTINCLNCQCGHSEGFCSECGNRICFGCGKEFWMHEHQFCNKKNDERQIAILEVDHQCWFSNTSEKYPDGIMLNSFSDQKDVNIGTHSGVVKIETKDKHKLLERILKQDIIKEAKLIHKSKDALFVRTRASINKSVDEFTKNNNSILLNPVIAMDSKEQNLIISPSQKEMKALSKGLQEFGGKVRLICSERFNLNEINKIENERIREFIDKVPKEELLEAMQKARIN